MTSSMNKIIDNLWQGDMVGAYNKFLLKRNGITHILTVAQGIMPKFPTLFNYKLVNILNIPSANLKQHFQTCIKYIKDSIAEGDTVYVHSQWKLQFKVYIALNIRDCYAGVSRSTTIIIAYLMQKHGMPYLDALQHCRKCRWFINPNDGFKRQLQTFSHDLASKRKNNGVNEGPSNEEIFQIFIIQFNKTKVETIVSTPSYDKFSVTDIKFQSKGMMVEGRSGSVPAVIRGLKQTEERSFQPHSPSKLTSGVIPGTHNLQVQKQNTEKIGSRAATTFNKIRVTYQSPVSKSQKTLMTQGLQMRTSPIATNSKFTGLKTSQSPYLPQQIQQIKSGVTVKTQMRYPNQNVTTPFGNSSGNYAKEFQISSQDDQLSKNMQEYYQLRI